MRKGLMLARVIVFVAIMSMTASSAMATTGWQIQNLSGYGLPNASITAIIVNILDWLLTIFGILGIIGFLIAGTMYILAAGDEKMIERAKEGMKYSIIGVVVGLAGLVAIGAINALLDAGYSGDI